MQMWMYAVPSLGAIGFGVALVGLFGRDPQASEHTIDDYRPTLAPARRDWPLLDRQPGGPRRLRAGAVAALAGRPASRPAPAPARGRSVFAETAAALGVCPVDAGAVVAVVADRYGDSPADRAARMLREIAAEQRAGAVSR